jgi:hypothetical protein
MLPSFYVLTDFKNTINYNNYRCQEVPAIASIIRAFMLEWVFQKEVW